MGRVLHGAQRHNDQWKRDDVRSQVIDVLEARLVHRGLGESDPSRDLRVFAEQSPEILTSAGAWAYERPET